MKPRKPVSAKTARDRLEDLCARSEQSTFEVHRKLHAWGVSSSDSESIIEHLKANRFIDDARFAKAFTRDKWEFARWGRIKIRARLRALAIDPDLIDEALESIEETAYRRGLVELLAAKARALGVNAATFDGGTKLLRFAASRGFEPSLAIKAIKSRQLWRIAQIGNGE